MVLPHYPPLRCPDGSEIPQSPQTDGLLSSEIKKLCHELLNSSATIQATTTATSEAFTEAASLNSSTIALAIGISVIAFMIVVCIIFAIKYRNHLTYEKICDCLTWIVGGIFCCLCDKRLSRLKRSKGIESGSTV